MIEPDKLRQLNPGALRDALIEVTIGGGREIDRGERAIYFKEYIQRALPGTTVLEITPIDTAAALNSVSGVMKLRSADGSEQIYFGKVHIESNTSSTSALGVEKEYENARLLSDAGWPVLQPMGRNTDKDYPLLLYPMIEDKALFTLLETSHTAGEVRLTPGQLELLAEYNRMVGEKEIESLSVGKTKEAIQAPVQTLFLERIRKGGRIDQWYTDSTFFKLPGLEQAISWKELLDLKWEINDISYDVTLREIIAQARQHLAFDDESEAMLIVSHGDDHSGNILMTIPPTVFDPAFAGWNPASLDVKALAHTGFLPMTALYYLPDSLEFSFQKNGDRLIVRNNMQDLPNYSVQEELARQIIDLRTIPLLRAISQKGGNLKNETQRIRCALASCALLTINVARMLEQRDGRGVGLLPMAIMFYELQGLPMLEYLDKSIKNL